MLDINNWQKFTLLPGQICIINPGDILKIKTAQKAADYQVIQIEQEYFQTLLGSAGYINLRRLAYHVFCMPAASANRMRMLEKELSGNDPDIQKIYGLIYSFADGIINRFIDRFLYQHYLLNNKDNTVRIICHAALHIRKHCLTSCNLRKMARNTGLSYGHFNRVFKNLYGNSPSIYKASLQLLLARQLVLGSALSVSRISRICGYINCSHFIRAYQKKFATTPNRDRKSIMADLAGKIRTAGILDMAGASLYDLIIIQE